MSYNFIHFDSTPTLYLDDENQSNSYFIFNVTELKMLYEHLFVMTYSHVEITQCIATSYMISNGYSD